MILSLGQSVLLLGHFGVATVSSWVIFAGNQFRVSFIVSLGALWVASLSGFLLSHIASLWDSFGITLDSIFLQLGVNPKHSFNILHAVPGNSAMAPSSAIPFT